MSLYNYELNQIVTLLGHYVTITLKASQVEGYLYTIDPSIGHVVLFDPSTLHVKVIMQQAIQDFKIDNENQIDLQNMDSILKYRAENIFTQTWINDRKNHLLQLLIKNRIPIEYRENDPVIQVLGSARVTSPYVISSVKCDNALIRTRVRDFILQLDY